MNSPGLEHGFPIGILRPLWKWLTPSQKGDFRQVCRSFKDEIDNNIGCEIYIKDKKFGALQGLAPPASKLHVLSLSPIYNVQMLLTDPQMITNLSLEGPINFQNLLKLLKISRNLERLSLLLQDFHITAKTSTSVSFFETPVLRSLTELRILHDFSQTQIQPPETIWQNVDYILMRVNIPNLETLFINNFFECPKEFEKSVYTLSHFIVKCQRTLKHLHLTLRVGQDCSHQHKTPYSHPKLKFKVSEDGLTHLETFAVHCDKPFHQAMDSILTGTKSLARLEYDKPWASWFFYAPIIAMNSDNLNCIKISNAAPPLNMESFRQCSSLKVLHLSKDPLSGDAKPTPNITNFEMLPKHIQELLIENYSVESLDLLTIRRLRMLRKLQLEFLSTRSAPDTGVTATIVSLLLSKFRKLEILLIEEVQTHNTSLDDIINRITEVNMVTSRTIRRLGFEKWALAIAPIATFETWRPRLLVYDSLCNSIT